MMLPSRNIRWVSWIAILAICAGTFMPLASRALAAWSGSSSPWDEICSSLGLQRTSSASEKQSTDQPSKPATLDQDRSCPFCLPSANPTPLPSQPTAIPPAVEQSTSRFLFFFISASPATLIYDAALPRAPPAA